VKDLRLGYAPFRLWWDYWRQIQSIEGKLLEGQDRWLLDVAHWLPDNANILEIGPYKGRGTACLAFGCLNTNKHVYAMDTFCGNDTDFIVDAEFYSDWRHNLAQLGGPTLLKHITPCIGRSSAFYKYWTVPIHFLFIDGSHVYEDVLKDFESFYWHVVPGGIIALHDVDRNVECPTDGWIGPHRVWHEQAMQLLHSVGFCSTIAYGRKG